MRIFGFGRDVGRHIDRFGSDFVIARLAHPEELHVACMYLAPGGLVGHHPAVTYQLFAVVRGDGWVQGEDGPRVPIRAGEAALWEPGEHHGAGTEGGMTVIVIEGDVLGSDLEAIGPIPGGQALPALEGDTGVLIRPYTTRDREGVREVLRAIGWEDRYVQGQLAALDEAVSGSGDMQALVAAAQNSVLGFASVAFAAWNRLGQIHGLAVRSEHQRQGIASSLVGETERFVRAKGGRGVMVDTPVTNQTARSFYTALGYREDYVMTEYYDVGLDGVTYLKLFEGSEQ